MAGVLHMGKVNSFEQPVETAEESETKENAVWIMLLLLAFIGFNGLYSVIEFLNSEFEN